MCNLFSATIPATNVSIIYSSFSPSILTLFVIYLSAGFRLFYVDDQRIEELCYSHISCISIGIKVLYTAKSFVFGEKRGASTARCRFAGGMTAIRKTYVLLMGAADWFAKCI